MQTEKYIHIADFKSIFNWSASSILRNKLSYKEKYALEKIGNLLIKNRNKIIIENEKEYRRVTIRLYGKGVLLRDIVKGNTIGTKNQFIVSDGQFIMSKIDARNGAFGIVPKELNGAAVTQDFLSYNINTQKILPEFFILVTSSTLFYDLCQQASSGTTGRQRVDETTFLNFEIPIPSILEQKKLIDRYSEKITLANEMEQESSNAEDAIEKYFLEILGLKKIEEKNREKGIHVINYSDFDRWDFFSTDNRVNLELKKTKFDLVRLGDIYNFTRRGWNSKVQKENTFRYIEIGAIDSLKGIMEAKLLETKKAPSRASQSVKKGDLIIATTRPYLKKFAIVGNEFDSCICSSGFSVIEQSGKYNLGFLKQFLMCTYGIEQLKNKMTGALY